MKCSIKMICMIAYARYSTDGRVKREAEALSKESDFDVVVVSLKERTEAREYTVNGVVVKEVNQSKYRGKSKIRYIVSYLEFVFRTILICSKTALNGKCEAYHVHNMPNFLIFSVLLPKLLGKKIVLDMHDTMPETFSTKFRNKYSLIYRLLIFEEKVCCSLADQIFSVNEVQKEAILRRGVNASKMTILMNVPDDRIFYVSNKGGESSNEKAFKIGYHGTVTKRLGIDLIIRTTQCLVDKISNLELHIWGYGDYLEPCIKLAKALGIEKKVVYRGVVPVDQLPKELSDVGIGIIPNRKNAATELMLPVKMLEYIALGIPVIAPRLRTIEYYFTDEMVSYFEPDNVDSMVGAIMRLWSDESTRRIQAENAKSFLLKYGWEKHRMNLINFYAGI